MIREDYFLLLVLMAIITFVPRWLPMYFFSQRKMPDWFVQWLELIPVAILSALLLPALVMQGTPQTLNLIHPKMIVAIPTFIFALKTKSFGSTVIVGMFLYWAFPFCIKYILR